MSRVSRTLVCLSALACLFLAGCDAAQESPRSADSPSSPTDERATRHPGQIPTREPTRIDPEGGASPDGSDGNDDTNGDSGTDGDETNNGSGTDNKGGSRGDGNDDTNRDSGTDGDETNNGSGTGNEGGSHGGDGPPAIEVAGPTLGNDYPEYWGNIYLTDRSKCANFANHLEYDVTILAISVSSPLVLDKGCSPHSGEPPSGGCTTGVVVAAQRGTTCTLGVAFAPGADLTKNYLLQNDWQLSVACTNTTAEPCNASEVVEAQPSPAAPVTITWTMVEPMRFCGATDYADEQGNPGSGGPPSDGCTAGDENPSSPSTDE